MEKKINMYLYKSLFLSNFTTKKDNAANIGIKINTNSFDTKNI